MNSIQATKFRIWATGILKDNGRISHKQAIEKAYQEYDIFNKTQPIESDFDMIVKGLSNAEK